jgi:hypothetical protein
MTVSHARADDVQTKSALSPEVTALLGIVFRPLDVVAARGVAARCLAAYIRPRNPVDANPTSHPVVA